MEISKDIENGPKSNNSVLVGICVIVCVQKSSHHFLQTFRPLRMFKDCVPRQFTLSETIVFNLSAMVDQCKR